MTLGRIIAPYTQIQDFSGRNNTRGLMYVYLEPNSTTRATLYKESTHEELTNPLTINDIGLVEDFVVDADYKYWIYVTDIDNNKVFDRHNLATMEESGGQSSEGYYDGDWIHIDESHRVNVNPTKQLSFETPLTVTENEDEIIIGCDTSNININLESKDGIATTKSGKKWIVSGKSLQDKDEEQDDAISGLDTRLTGAETWQSNHGKVLTINVNSDSYAYDGSNTLTVPITIPQQKTTTTFLGSNIYQASPTMDAQSSGTVLSILGNIPNAIQLEAGKTYLIQPSVVGTADYTLGASSGRSARFSLEMWLAEEDVTESSAGLYGKAIPIAATQFNLKTANGSDQAGYRFITAIGSQSVLYTPPTDQTFTKIVLANNGNVLGGNGSTKCWMDFKLGLLIITEVE